MNSDCSCCVPYFIDSPVINIYYLLLQTIIMLCNIGHLLPLVPFLTTFLALDFQTFCSTKICMAIIYMTHPVKFWSIWYSNLSLKKACINWIHARSTIQIKSQDNSDFFCWGGGLTFCMISAFQHIEFDRKKHPTAGAAQKIWLQWWVDRLW